MDTKTRFRGNAAIIVALAIVIACLAGGAGATGYAWAQMSQEGGDAPMTAGARAVEQFGSSSISTQAATINEVRSLIEGLPAVSDVTLEDGGAIAQARTAYDALTPAEQKLLDTETNRAALNTTQSYGRVLELAEAGYAVLIAVDNSTSLADGVYVDDATCEWNRGKSASKQDRDWTVRRLDVRDGKAFVTLGINSSTYSYLRASGVTVQRLAASGSEESLFAFPVALNAPMVFCAYSDLMAAEIAYNLKVTVSDDAQPDAEPDASGGESDGGNPSAVDVGVPVCVTDSVTGAVVAEKGTFAHPEVKSKISPMFRIVNPAVLTSDGQTMTVFAQMPSSSYSHLFIGTAEQASAKSLEDGVADGSFVEAQQVKNESGSTVSAFTFPLASLDQDLAVCLYTRNNKHWVDHVIRFNSEDLAWHTTEETTAQLQAAIAKLETLPARNTIVPDNAEHEASVREARGAYDALSRYQKAQVPVRLTVLLKWDESMFDLGFNTEQLPLALVGQPYDGAVYLSGKNLETGKTACVTSGALPEGLSVEVDEKGRWAHFAGTPGRVGSSTFTIELTNGAETVSKQFTIHVGYAPHILTESLAEAQVGVAYEQVIEVDAYPDATWSIAEGKLPAGLSLVDDGEYANTAHIRGVPTEAGSFAFTLACDNFANGVETATYTLSVASSAADQQIASLAASLEDMRTELGNLKSENARIGAANSQAEVANGLLTAEVESLKARVSQLEALQPQPVIVNVKTVTAKKVKAALRKARNPYATSITLGAKVKTIKKGAFASTDIRKIIVKSKKLTKKRVKGSLAGSHVKTLKVPKTKKAAYKKAFAKANSGRKAVVK